MKRSIWFWLYFGLSVLLAIYLAVRLTMTSMGMGRVGIVRRVSVSADTPDQNLAAIAAAAAVPPNMRIRAAGLRQIGDKIAAVPDVHKYAVRRLPNGNLAVRVHLYKPVAQWFDGTNYFPLSADGTVVRRPAPTRDGASVTFRGPLPDDITEITNAAHNLIDDVDYLEWIENRRWNLVTRGGITVLLPEQNPVAAIGTLIVLNNNNRILSRQIRVIDMRDDGRILVK